MDSMTNNINRIAILYRDLLSNRVHSLSKEDADIVLSLKPNANKIIAIGGIDSDNWNAYPLTYLLHHKLVAPTVLSESQIYQSWHAMRVHDEKILHPQNLISQSVVIRFMGLDNSANINDYFNSFVSMCAASDECKVIFVVFECNKRSYKNNIYVRKANSTFIDTSNGKPYTVESSPLCISPEEIVFFSSGKSAQKSETSSVKSTQSRRSSSLSSLLSCKDEF
jgi:hypothetical protein